MKEKSIKQNAVLNSLKQVCAVVFPIVTLPYITRVLGAGNYGKVNFANSIVSYFSLIAALGIPNYTVREGAPIRGDKEKFNRFANEILTINIASSVIAYLLLLAVMTVPRLQDYQSLILIQSLAILFTTLGTDWINTIFEDFGYITLRYIFTQVIALICMFIFVRSAEDYMRYAFILVMANSGANLLNIWYVRRYVKLRPVFHANLKKHLKPLLLLFANTIAITIYINSDITILGFLKNDDAVGIYTLSSRIYLTVKQVLNAVIMVTVPRLSVYLNNDDRNAFEELLSNLLNALICMVLPVLVLLFMLSDRAMLIAGGSEYVSGAMSLQILSLALAGAVFACFFSSCILLPARKDAMFLKSTIVGAAVNIGINIVAIPVLGINGAALTTLLAETTVLIMLYTASRSIARCTIRKETVVSTAVSCICIAAVCLVCRKMISQVLVSTLLSMLLSGLVYVLAMVLMNRKAVESILSRRRF